MEVSQSLLRGTLRALVHPWELCPLQTVQQLVLFYGISEPVLSLIVLEEVDALFETPVVGKTCDSCMSVKRRSLMVARVELIPVSFIDKHRNQNVVLRRQYKAIQSFEGEIP